MMSAFNGIANEEYKARYRRCMDEAQKRSLDGIVVISCSASPENLIYLSNISLVGVDIPSFSGGYGGAGYYGVAILTPEAEEPKVVLDRDWYIGPASLHSSTQDIVGGTDIWQLVADVLAEKGLTKGKLGLVIDGVPVAKYRDFSAKLPQVEWVDCDDILLKSRLIKSLAEVSLIEGCLDRLGEATAKAITLVEEGVKEWELAVEIKKNLTSQWS
jgi:Xaa-Pro aminopeptidase